MSRSREAFWWSLFSAGGVMSAIFVPALLVATGLLLPVLAGDDAATQHERLDRIVSFWPVRLALLAIIALGFFHCAHRIRHILIDVGLRHAGPLLSVACYGGAVAGTVLGGVFVVSL